MLTWLNNARVVACCASMLFGLTAWPAFGQQVIVLGSLDDVVGWLQAENWWGEEKHSEQLRVPYAMITGISPRWRETAQRMPVAEKKEIFYRFILPLVMHANTMVLDRRARLEHMADTLAGGGKLQTADLEWLREAAVLPIYDAGNIGMQRRKIWGVLADPDFNPRAFADSDPIEFKKTMEGYGSLAEVA